MKITINELVQHAQTIRDLGNQRASSMKAALAISEVVEKIEKILFTYEKQRQSLILDLNITNKDNPPTVAQQKEFNEKIYEKMEDSVEIEPFLKDEFFENKKYLASLPISKFGFLNKFIIKPEVKNEK